MGQRLCLNIRHGDNILANGYYHWSGYTLSAVEIIKEAIDEFYGLLDDKGEPKTLKDNMYFAIKMLEATGAGVNEEEKNEIKNTSLLSGFSYRNSIDRNRGLLSVSKNGIKETQDWAEAEATIDIGLEAVDFSVYFMSNKNEFIREYMDCYDSSLEEATRVYDEINRSDFDFSHIPFEDFDDFSRQCESVSAVKDADGYVYEWIE